MLYGLVFISFGLNFKGWILHTRADEDKLSSSWSSL